MDISTTRADPRSISDPQLANIAGSISTSERVASGGVLRPTVSATIRRIRWEAVHISPV